MVTRNSPEIIVGRTLIKPGTMKHVLSTYIRSNRPLEVIHLDGYAATHRGQQEIYEPGELNWYCLFISDRALQHSGGFQSALFSEDNTETWNEALGKLLQHSVPFIPTDDMYDAVAYPSFRCYEREVLTRPISSSGEQAVFGDSFRSELTFDTLSEGWFVLFVARGDHDLSTAELKVTAKASLVRKTA